MENESNLYGNAVDPTTNQAPLNPVPEVKPIAGTVPQSTNVPPLSNVPPTDVAPKSFITPGSGSTSRSKSKFGLFVVLGIIVIALIYGGVAFIYLQNKNLIKLPGSPSNNQAAETQLTPTPEFSTDNIKIDAGNISYKTTGETRILVNKADYPGSGITGFLKFAVSPDKTKICFESWSPAPKPAMYVSDVGGQNVKEVSSGKRNCTWSPDGKKIFYVSTALPATYSQIFVQDLEKNEETNISETSHANGAKRNFEIVGLSADGTNIICSYTESEPSEEAGQCQISLATSALTYP